MRRFAMVKGVSGFFIADHRVATAHGGFPRGLGKRRLADPPPKRIGSLDTMYENTEQLIDITNHQLRLMIMKEVNGGRLELIGTCQAETVDEAITKLERE